MDSIKQKIKNMKDYEGKNGFIKTIAHDPEDDIVRKKVLFACINAPSYSPAGMVDGWKKCGYEVHSFDWQHIRYQIGVEDMQDRLIAKAAMEEPEIIFLHVQNKDAVDVEVAKVLSQRGFVINFTEDVRNDISWYEELAPHIGLTVFTNMEDVEKMKAKGINNVAYIPTSYNHTLYHPQPKTDKDFGEVIFLGTKYINTNLNFPKAQERQDMIAFMKKQFGRRFRAYGIGQDNRALTMSEAAEAYNNCKIAITHNNFFRKGYCSDRGFNSMGCEAFTVSHYFPESEKLGFMPFVRWKEVDDLATVCDDFLRNDKARAAVARKNYEQVLEHHLWRNRFEVLIEEMNKIKSQKKEIA